jgi:hypothetical protein
VYFVGCFNQIAYVTRKLSIDNWPFFVRQHGILLEHQIAAKAQRQRILQCAVLLACINR